MSEFKFSNADRQQISDALIEYMGGTDESDINDIIDQIEKTGSVLTFGFGSLIKVPFSDRPATTYDATLHGWETRFNMKWKRYGGTKENPSLMMGAEKEEDGTLPGLVSEQKISKDGKLSVDDIIECFKKWDARENPPENPIYNFPLVEVVANNGQKVKAFVCASNTESDLYMGGKLTLQEQAIIIAEGIGKPYIEENGKRIGLQPHQLTAAAYLHEFIDARLSRGYKVEPELQNLLNAVNNHRELMKQTNPELLKELQVREEMLSIRNHLDPRVFEVTEEKMNLTDGEITLKNKFVEEARLKMKAAPVRLEPEQERPNQQPGMQLNNE